MLAVVAPVLQRYEPPVPAPAAVRVAELPAHIDGLLTVGVGLAEVVTVLVADAVHPEVLLAVTVYVPAADTVIDAVVSELLQAYPVPPVAVIVVGAPEQITPFVTDTLGTAEMVTIPAAVAVQLPILVTVTVYVPAVVTLILCVVCTGVVFH